MELSIKIILLLLATMLTGLSAGLCFTWTNSITPGIGRLEDLGYLKSFQQMNRAIINPMFMVVFFGPLFANLLNIYLFRNTSGTIFWLLLIATALYFFGLVLVTLFGNVPLNEILDKTDLAKASSAELSALRGQFELRWNRLHLVRTITSSLSFFLLLLSLILSGKNNIL